MASFGVSLPEFDPPDKSFNSYALYEADISDNPYLGPESVRNIFSLFCISSSSPCEFQPQPLFIFFKVYANIILTQSPQGSTSITQDLAALSIPHLPSAYSEAGSTSSSGAYLPSAYSESPSFGEHSQSSSLSTMPYAEEPISTATSRPSFGVAGSSFASLPSADSYTPALSDSYTTEIASPSAPSSLSLDGYASLPSDLSASSYDTYMAESGGVDASYPYDSESQPLPTTTRLSATSSQRSSPAPQPTPSPAPEPTGQAFKNDGRNWTRDFYTVQSTISKGGSLLDPVQVMTQLSTMTAQFTEDAVKYGSIIIREQMLPVNKKTIKPVNVGGIAGGAKFVHAGIFFKFPTDEAKLYGNLENAMRGAGHELKGLTALINWELKTIGLHSIKFPLTAIIDYYGYRLVATAVLPLSGKTMCLGSGDAGRTVLDGSEPHQRKSAQQLANLIADWGKFINVAPHDFRSTSLNQRIANVKICFDLEGHVGTDGSYYLCDFARTFPPADPMGGSGRFLYRLLRPEFVKKYRKPISSDSFMSMQVDKSLNQITRDATKYLMTEWLIEAVKVWNKTVNCILPPNIISLLAHQSGINLRFLRLCAAVVTDNNLRKAVHVEIIARTVKSIVRNEIRESGRFEDEDILTVITKYFNLLFTDNEDSQEFWNRELQLEILKRFEAPSKDFFDLVDELLSAPATPSGSPAPSRSNSLFNSAQSLGSSSQNSDANSSSGQHSPSLSRSTSASGGRSRAKKSTSARSTPEKVPSPAQKKTSSKRSTATKSSETSASPSTKRTKAKIAVSSPSASQDVSMAESPLTRRNTRGAKSNSASPHAQQHAYQDEDFTPYGEDIEDDDSSEGANEDLESFVPYGEVVDKPRATRRSSPSVKAVAATSEPAAAVRRSTRVRVPVEGPIPDWILQMESEDDADYNPSESESEESEDSSDDSSDVSGDEVDSTNPASSSSYYGTGYSDDALAYGAMDGDDSVSKQPKAKSTAKKTKSKLELSNKSTPNDHSSPSSSASKALANSKTQPVSPNTSTSSLQTTYSDTRELSDSGSQPLQDTPTPPLTPSHSGNFSSFGSPSLMKSPSFGVRVDRGLGILRHQVHLDQLYARLQQLLGCFFGTSGDAKFKAVLMHHQGETKSALMRTAAGSKFNLKSTSGSGVKNSGVRSPADLPSNESSSSNYAAETNDGDSAEGSVIQIEPHPVLDLRIQDVDSYRPRIKQMFLTPFQVAFSLKKEADFTEDFDQREELLRRASEAYLECLERNPLGDFALHNASRVLQAWLPFFPEANSNDAKCVAYLAKRFAALAEKENRDLANFKADIYKSSDMIEPRTGKVLKAHQPEWCSDSIIKNLVLRKTELAEMVEDIITNAQQTDDPASTSDLELRVALRDSYDSIFDDLSVDPSATSESTTKLTAKKTASSSKLVIERKVAIQYWKMLVAVIHPSNPEKLDKLVEQLYNLPKERAFLTKTHWAQAAAVIF